jgi:SAM-dependent methyltransferase
MGCLKTYTCVDPASVHHKLRYGFDSYERHFIAASFIRFMNYRSVIDIGGLPDRVTRLKAGSSVDILSANLSEPADVIYDGDRLPFEDSSFDGAVSLDVLEHVPPDRRRDFIREAVRVSAGPVLVSVPYRSDAHEASEREIQELHKQVFGTPHRFLAEHIERGLVNEDDLRGYLSVSNSGPPLRFSCFYTGNIDNTARPLRRALHYRGQGRLSYLVHLPSLAWSRSSPVDRVECYTMPSAETNRLYAIVSR